MGSGRIWKYVGYGTAGLLLVGVAALAAAIAFGTAKPPAPVHPRHLDLTGLPPISRFAARDGAQLAYRFYPGSPRDVVVLIHGTATESSVMNALAKTLNADGATVYAPDLRGHGRSGPRGDIAYIGQLDDDLADLVAKIRASHENARFTLIGFSGGGAFVIRIAGGPYGALFDRYIVIDPAIVYPSPIARPNAAAGRRPIFPVSRAS